MLECYDFRYQSKGPSSLKSTRKGNKKCRGKLINSGIAFNVFFDKYCLPKQYGQSFQMLQYWPYFFYFSLRFTIRTDSHGVPPHFKLFSNIFHLVVLKSSIFGVIKCKLFCFIWIYLVIYGRLYAVWQLCRIRDFHFQYPNWPIYPFTIYLKSCITEIQDYFINIQE